MNKIFLKSTPSIQVYKDVINILENDDSLSAFYYSKICRLNSCYKIYIIKNSYFNLGYVLLVDEFVTSKICAIDIGIKSNFQNQGLASKVIDLILSENNNNYGIYAEVDNNIINSTKLFQKKGYKVISMPDRSFYVVGDLTTKENFINNGNLNILEESLQISKIKTKKFN